MSTVLWQSGVVLSIDKKGRKRQWVVKAEEYDGGITILREYGHVGGKLTTVTKPVKIVPSNGKNLQEQAISEAQTLYKNQKDTGDILPMLAHRWRPDRFPGQRVFVQPKLDGVRMLAGMVNGRIKLCTRTGKEVKSMGHIIPEISKILEEDEFLDGEVYSDTLPFQQISGKFRKHETCEELKFHVFDMFKTSSDGRGFRERFVESKVSNLKYVSPVESWYIPGNQIMHYHEKFAREGYEGIIIRHPSGPYECGFRSQYLMKHKVFDDDEFEIVGCEEGTGRDEGTAIFRCKCDAGEFGVRPMGTHEVRKEYFDNQENYIGKKLTVKYQGKSTVGIPRFPIGIGIRDYE